MSASRSGPRGLPPVVIRVAPDGKTFLTLDAQQEQVYWMSNSQPSQLVRISVWSVKRGELLRSAKIPTGTAPVLAIAPDSRTFVTCHTNALAIRDVEDLEAAPRRVRNDSRAHFNALAFHPSGRYLAATTSDKTVKLFDTTTWEVARAFTWDIGRLRSITFSPDGRSPRPGATRGRSLCGMWTCNRIRAGGRSCGNFRVGKSRCTPSRSRGTTASWSSAGPRGAWMCGISPIPMPGAGGSRS